jgi:hypothetical protein
MIGGQDMTGRIAAALALGLAWLAGGTPAQALKSETQNGIPIVTGGVGVPETQELHRMRFKHTLRVTTANARTGKYLSDCRIVVATQAGRVLVDATPEGPMLMAKLPAGYYWLRATCNGRTQERVVLVVPEKYVTDSVFYWD